MPTSSSKTASSSHTTEKKKIPTIAIVGIGCLAFLVILGIVLSIAGKVLFSTIGQKFMGQGIKNVIEKQSGVKIETNADGEVVSFKDKKTGSEVSVGSDKIPAGFPGDFPIYPGAKVTGNVSGSDTDTEKGFWLLMESTDAADKITTFYAQKLKPSGWATEETASFDNSSTWKVSKGNMEGAVVVSSGDEKKTSILITLSTVSTE